VSVILTLEKIVCLEAMGFLTVMSYAAPGTD